MKTRPSHPHHYQSQIVSDLIGVFDETSPLRKLFRNSTEFQFCIDMITRYGPPHECFNMGLLLRHAEVTLRMIEKDVEIKPIEDGLELRSYSPHHSAMILPLKYPKVLLNVVQSSENAEMYIADGPVERALSNAILANVSYYYSLYVELKSIKS